MIIENPVRVLIGKGSLCELSALLAGKKYVVFSSSGFKPRGWDRFFTTPLLIIDRVNPNPSVDDIREYLQTLGNVEFDTVVAIGGGSVLDSAKICAYLQHQDLSELMELLEGRKKLTERKRKSLICLPTTSGTGAEVTPFATVWDKANQRKLSLASPSLFPDWAVIDPELTRTLNKDTTIITALDSLSHLFESLWNRNASPYTNALGIEGVRTILDTLPLVLEDLQNLELREKLCWASYLGGCCIAQTRTAVAHSISYPLTAHLDIPHGLAAGMFLKEIYDFNKKHDVGSALAEIEARLARPAPLTLELENLFKLIDQKTELFRNIRAKKERILELVPEMINPARAGNNICHISVDDIKSILNHFPW